MADEVECQFVVGSFGATVRVLTDDLGTELLALLRKWPVGRVDIASAWATEGVALDALEDLKKRRRKGTKVRTLAGIAGNHTTPGALDRLAKLGEVRLVNDRSGLFHVKLVLFRTSRKSLAWVGSANFTGPGFDGNEELIYETEETEGLAEWFDRRWKQVGPQRDQPASYCKKWKPPAVPMRGVDQPKNSKRPPVPKSDARGASTEPAVIVFHQKGKRPTPYTGKGKKRESPRGKVTIGNITHEYKSAVDCLKIVLDELQQRDSGFLKRCSTDADFRRGESHYIARTRSGLGSLNKAPKPLNGGWYLGGGGTMTSEKWKLILAAARITGFEVEVVGTMWQAEGKKGAIEVGF